MNIIVPISELIHWLCQVDMLVICQLSVIKLDIFIKTILCFSVLIHGIKHSDKIKLNNIWKYLGY